MSKRESRLKVLKRKAKPKIKKFFSILLGVVLFIILMGSAFAISFLFGAAFIIAFALAIYNGELIRKPWKPIAIFVGALIIRFATGQYLNPIKESKTLLDLGVSALIFLSILIFGWKIKKS
jgi:Na+-translocating ferredoxin:NAD+ oxidoreductase RnfD subunit